MFDQVPGEWVHLAKAGVSSLIVIVCAAVLYITISRVLRAAEGRGTLSAPVPTVLRVATRWILIGTVILIVLQQFDILENIWAALLAIFSMVAIGFFAVWSVLSNVLCTLLILIYRPYQIGDKVEFPSDALAGRIIDLNFLFTTLKDENDAYINVPNNTFFQKPFRRIPGNKLLDLYDQLKKKEPTL